MIKVNGQLVQPIKFPDGTTQVNKIRLTNPANKDEVKVEWKWESDAEVFYMAQILQIFNIHKIRDLIIYTDYLPYARQDHMISNETTFCLRTLGNILKSSFDGRITVVSKDPHSSVLNEYVHYFLARNEELHNILKKYKGYFTVFPDQGAKDRYGDFTFNDVVFNKTRDLETGEVDGLKLVDGPTFHNGTEYGFLIIDDICDGGRTFIETAKKLKEHYPDNIMEIVLYTTHGIYSKGTKCLFDAGITKIYNHEGEVK